MVETRTGGDFWIGCSPERSWANTEPDKVHWTLNLEVPLALALLERAALDRELSGEEPEIIHSSQGEIDRGNVQSTAHIPHAGAAAPPGLWSSRRL